MSRTERTKWRVRFRQLAMDAQSALHAEDTAPAERAMELMIDLARHADGSFRSEDPLEAAKFVISQAAFALWETVLSQHGFAQFAERAAPQLVRWETAYGWTRGWGKVAERERPLADVLASMLTTPGMWTEFADVYLAELDRIASAERPPAGNAARRGWNSSDNEWQRSDRTANLARWNSLLFDHVDEERGERLANHQAFGGADADFLRARAAQQRGDDAKARTLIGECLARLPGREEFVQFAEEVGAKLPPRALRT